MSVRGKNDEARMEKRAAKALRKPFIRALYRGNAGNCVATIVYYLVEAALAIYIAYILQQLIDAAISGDRALLGSMALQTLTFFLLDGALQLLGRETRNRFLKRGMKQYKAYAFDRIVEKNISGFSSESTGRYLSALTNDATQIEQNYLRGSIRMVYYAAWFAGALAMMFWYNWSLSLVVLGLSTVPIVVSVLFGGRLAREEKQVSDRNEGFVGMVKDLLAGFTVIKSFKAEKEIRALFAKNDDTLESCKDKRRRVAELIEILSGGAGFILQFGIFLYGALLAIQGHITVGVMMAFVQLLNYVITPVQQLPSLFANCKAARGLVDKLASAVSENSGRGGKLCPPVLETGIALQNVVYGYEPGKPVLKNLSVTFEKGKSYAVVGASGSGKTTLLNLLLGSSGDYEGSIRIDENELRDIAGESLYDILSIIQQNVFVFDSSIQDNITMFKSFSRERVESAIDRAGLRRLIAERGAAYDCGENGVGLSGGERQRISIARCLLCDTPVLLMDEATAALDAETAHAVTSSILDIANLTRIIVTHKLEEALLTRFDEILVLKNGALLERGRFAELMAEKGYFYSLYTVSHVE